MNLLRKIFHGLPGLPWLYHSSLALASAVVYGFPSRRILVIGVTGTKGKSTVVELIDAILTRAGMRTAILSSIKVKVADRLADNPTENTMPGRFSFSVF